MKQIIATKFYLCEGSTVCIISDNEKVFEQFVTKMEKYLTINHSAIETPKNIYIIIRADKGNNDKNKKLKLQYSWYPLQFNIQVAHQLRNNRSTT